MSTHSSPSTNTAAPPAPPRKALTVKSLRDMKQSGEKIAALTCYDACFALLEDAAGVDVLLVGDSLGMVLGAASSTLPVTLEQMAYHTRCVAAGNQSAVVMADLPFGSYQASPQEAYRSAATLMAAGAHMVKLEGGAWLAPTVEFISTRDIPVCAHLGLTPQSVHALGGYRLQGKDEAAAQTLHRNALQMEESGAAVALFELIPGGLASSITQALKLPTIGIGAGAGCDGQVLVLHDMLNLTLGRKPRFVRNFMAGQASVQDALASYVQAVKHGSFPGPEHTFA